MSRRRYYDDDDPGHTGKAFTSNPGEKPCRACSDFKTFMKSKGKHQDQQSGKDCPLDRNELGRASWSLLHSIAAYFPDKPSTQQQSDMKSFIRIFSNIYPCKECASDMRNDINDEPPITTSRHDLSQWMCRLHNKVNNKLGKDLFDCNKVDERWLEGWKDGSCG